MFAQDLPWDDINTFLAIIGGALLLGLAGGLFHFLKRVNMPTGDFEMEVKEQRPLLDTWRENAKPALEGMETLLAETKVGQLKRIADGLFAVADAIKYAADRFAGDKTTHPLTVADSIQLGMAQAASVVAKAIKEGNTGSI
jgi:hypothetical protein